MNRVLYRIENGIIYEVISTLTEGSIRLRMTAPTTQTMDSRHPPYIRYQGTLYIKADRACGLR